MVPLPSYKEATAKPDWLRLVAPYVRFDDYRSLCLVNRRSWRIFAPCLWADLLRAVRRAGLDPGDGESSLTSPFRKMALSVLFSW